MALYVLIEPNAPRPPINGEPFSAVAPQGEAAHVGTDSEALAGRGGRSEGEDASVSSPLIWEAA